MSDFGGSSPLSTIKEIQRRLARPSQENSFLRDPVTDRGDPKDLGKSERILRKLGDLNGNIVDKPCENRHCLVKPAKIAVSSSDFADLKTYGGERLFDNSQTVGNCGSYPHGEPEERNIGQDSGDFVGHITGKSGNEPHFFEGSASNSKNSCDLTSDFNGYECPKECAAFPPNSKYLLVDLDPHDESAETDTKKFEISKDLILDAVLGRPKAPESIEKATKFAPNPSSIADCSPHLDPKLTANSAMIIHGGELPKRKLDDERILQNVGNLIGYPIGREEESSGKSVKRARNEEKGRTVLEDYLHPSLLSAAASKMRMKMKKSIFDWPSEELRALDTSNAQATDGIRGDSSVFRRFDEVILRLFHCKSAS